jgi:glucose/arabinose dehydrogenase
MKVKKLVTLLLFLKLSAAYSIPPQQILSQLRLPVGFKISIYAENVYNARSMALGDKGVVFVGSTNAGKVYALQDADHNGKAEKVYTIASGLRLPIGVAYKNGSLYVSAVNRILRYDQIMSRLAKPPAAVVIYNKFPTETHHGWKYLRFGPDGKLYTAIGAPCNICNPDKPYASLVRMNEDGSGLEILARGIRNTVGFDWHPTTNSLYFTDNGRDLLGDTTPAEELNRWSGKIGQHFGYPFCHAGNVIDPQYGSGKSCSQYTGPLWRFRAHNAPLGAHFYRGDQFPAAYKNRLIVAMHGSWNRSTPDGYRVVSLNVKGASISFGSELVAGWLTPQMKIIGRPVDVLDLPDGSLLISDDWNGLVYRVTYQG